MEKNTAYKDFDLLLDSAADHFFENYIKISLKGYPLNKNLYKLANKMGVKKPCRIRLMKISESEFLSICGLKGNKEFLKQLPDLNSNKYRFMIYKYGLVVKKNDNLLENDYAEMFRFIVFYERFGSIKNFLNVYLRSVLSFGWDKNPFNSDAKLAALTCR